MACKTCSLKGVLNGPVFLADSALTGDDASPFISDVRPDVLHDELSVGVAQATEPDSGQRIFFFVPLLRDVGEVIWAPLVVGGVGCSLRVAPFYGGRWVRADSSARARPSLRRRSFGLLVVQSSWTGKGWVPAGLELVVPPSAL